MRNYLSTSSFIYFVFIIIFLGSCKKKEIESEPEIPVGKSFLTLEMNGKNHTYIEGDPNVDVLNTFSFSTQQPNPGHGGGLELPDKSRWEFYFFFSSSEFLANTGNFPLLFRPGKYDYIKLDRNYEYQNIRGVEIINRYSDTDGSQKWRSSAYQENKLPQNFEVTNAYFYNSTYDRFIWVEGNFECAVGFFDNLKPVKGKFRVKVQHDLQ